MKEWQAGWHSLVDNTLDEFFAATATFRPPDPKRFRWGINPADSHPGAAERHTFTP